MQSVITRRSAGGKPKEFEFESVLVRTDLPLWEPFRSFGISAFLGQQRQLWRGAMKRRRRVKQIFPLEERLTQEARELRKRAKALPPGRERELLLKRARRDETTAHLTEWLLSPGSRAPI